MISIRVLTARHVTWGRPVHSPAVHHRRVIALIAILAVSIGTLSACGDSSSGPGGPAADGSSGWPLDVEIAALGGGTIDGNDYEGTHVAAWFWAPW